MSRSTNQPRMSDPCAWSVSGWPSSRPCSLNRRLLPENELLHPELYAPLHLVAGDSVYFDGRAGYALVRDSEAPRKALLVIAGDSQA